MSAFVLMHILMCEAMLYGKVIPIRSQTNIPSGSYIYVVKDVSQLAEFADLILDVDNSRRLLELREGINEAKAKHFTFKCICGSTYASVFNK